MTTPTIRAALDTFQQAANRGTAVYLSPRLVQELRTALKAEPEGPSEIDLINLAEEFGGEPVASMRRALELWGTSATPPSPETPAEALAARPLLEQVAAMADCIGGNTVGQITAISNRAAAWLRQNPPGRPVAIEPRGCPTPGACSCVEPIPPAPETGEVGELVEFLMPSREQAGAISLDAFVKLRRAATLIRQQEAELAALRGVPVAVSERLPDEKAYHPELGWCWGYRYGRWTMMEESCFAPPKEHVEATHWRPHNAIPLPAPQAGEAQRDAVLQAVAEALGGAYDCQRVWEAWNVGTMGPDDFTLTAEDGDRVAEIADAAIEAFRTFQVPAPQAGEGEA